MTDAKKIAHEYYEAIRKKRANPRVQAYIMKKLFYESYVVLDWIDQALVANSKCCMYWHVMETRLADV